VSVIAKFAPVNSKSRSSDWKILPSGKPVGLLVDTFRELKLLGLENVKSTKAVLRSLHGGSTSALKSFQAVSTLPLRPSAVVFEIIVIDRVCP